MTEADGRKLSSGSNHEVWALSAYEVAKVFKEDSFQDLHKEQSILMAANNINGLAVRFLRLEEEKLSTNKLLIMERLYPVDFRSLERNKRVLLFETFEYELAELHKHGIVHRDLLRPESKGAERFDNILLTLTGIRLIDFGISAQLSNCGKALYEKYLKLEIEEIQYFKQYFINR